ncbi:hypothetical protein ACMFMG_000717 [Clarireedia jacksonii]
MVLNNRPEASRVLSIYKWNPCIPIFTVVSRCMLVINLLILPLSSFYMLALLVDTISEAAVFAGWSIPNVRVLSVFRGHGFDGFLQEKATSFMPISEDILFEIFRIEISKVYIFG